MTRATIVTAAVLVAATGGAAAQESPAQFLKRLFQPPVDAISEAFRPPAKKSPAATELVDVPMPHLNPADASATPALGYLPETNAVVAAPPAPRPPPELAALPPEPAPAAPPRPPSAACAVALTRLGVAATPLAPISEGQCSVAAPVAVASLADGAVDFTTKAIVDCDLAEALAGWLTGSVEPEAEKILGERVTGFRIVASYACRNRDNLANAKLSEHARGNAVDISAFRVGERWLEVGAGWRGGGDRAFLAAIRTATCGRFKTVLGPGADSFHTDHFHLDLAKRRNGSTYCE